MIKVLFVCWGNICRSPMAEYIFKDMVSKAGMDEQFIIDSAAVSTEELGNPVYSPARALLGTKGIDCKGHHARQVRKADYDAFDYIIGMENTHLRIMRDRFFGGDPVGKLHLMMDYSSRPGSQVADPWYTGDFERTYEDLVDGLNGLLKQCIMKDNGYGY